MDRCPRCGASLAPGAHYCPHCGARASGASGSVATTSPSPGAAAGPEALLQALREATLGEYEILAEIGRGGMATVYLAHDLALNRKVAIKVLSPALLLMGEGMVERFKREARTAASLSHPHIIPIYAVKESPKVLYFVMRLVEGRALDSIIAEVGRLPIPMVQAILSHVADALGYAHRHGVIHRDIKAANIMLDEEGSAVVTDFGIAKVVQAEGLTMTGVLVGTPAYMSPEQCATQEVTGASDQYSLGVVAYELLTGKLPFEGNSIMAIMHAHYSESPRPVTEARPDCPPALAAAVMRMLDKDPTQRWPSMDDVVAAAGRLSLAHDDPVRVRMVSLARTGSRSQLLAAIRTPTSPIPPAKPLSRPPATVTPSRTRRLSGAFWGGVALAAVGAGLWWLRPWRSGEAPPPVPSAAVAESVGPAHPRETSRAPRQGPVPRPSAAREPVGRPPTEPAPPNAAVPQREDSLIGSLRASALEALRRALDAGATRSDLAGGDSVFKAAESLAGRGLLSEAMVRLATVASLWSEAERAARARVVRDTPERRAAEPRPAPPVAEPPADPRPEIAKVIADYARAIESLDLAEVRAVYPALTTAQEKGWKEFFESVRNLKADLTVTALDVAGGRAEVKVGGAYVYENVRTRRTERLAVAFQATLERRPSGWRLVSIR